MTIRAIILTVVASPGQRMTACSSSLIKAAAFAVLPVSAHAAMISVGGTEGVDDPVSLSAQPFVGLGESHRDGETAPVALSSAPIWLPARDLSGVHRGSLETETSAFSGSKTIRLIDFDDPTSFPRPLSGSGNTDNKPKSLPGLSEPPPLRLPVEMVVYPNREQSALHTSLTSRSILDDVGPPVVVGESTWEEFQWGSASDGGTSKRYRLVLFALVLGYLLLFVVDGLANAYMRKRR